MMPAVARAAAGGRRRRGRLRHAGEECGCASTERAGMRRESPAEEVAVAVQGAVTGVSAVSCGL
jgi:hypothetical protein